MACTLTPYGAANCPTVASPSVSRATRSRLVGSARAAKASDSGSVISAPILNRLVDADRRPSHIAKSMVWLRTMKGGWTPGRLPGRLAVPPRGAGSWSLIVVREGGVEPPHPFGYTDLNRARLPIPPLARVRTNLPSGGRRTDDEVSTGVPAQTPRLRSMPTRERRAGAPCPATRETSADDDA